MIILQAINPHWLDSEGDTHDDQCSHGHIQFEVNGTVFVSHEDGELTLSAAALYLLRTLDNDHTHEASVTAGNQLFPCCGFNVIKIDSPFSFLIPGCPNGVDIEVQHHHGSVYLSRGAKKETVSHTAWTTAVHAFAAQVEHFYSQSAPRKSPSSTEELAAWEAFWTEWKQYSVTE